MFISGIVVKLMIYMSEKTLMSLFDEVLKIRQLLEIIVKNDLAKELEKILTTKERKLVWALSDGFTDTKAISQVAGVSVRAVQIAVKELQNAELLVVKRRGFPKRKFDYVPTEWKPQKRGEKVE